MTAMRAVPYARGRGEPDLFTFFFDPSDATRAEDEPAPLADDPLQAGQVFHGVEAGLLGKTKAVPRFEADKLFARRSAHFLVAQLMAGRQFLVEQVWFLVSRQTEYAIQPLEIAGDLFAADDALDAIDGRSLALVMEFRQAPSPP
jgi:hypothetical protein